MLPTIHQRTQVDDSYEYRAVQVASGSYILFFSKYTPDLKIQWLG